MECTLSIDYRRAVDMGKQDDFKNLTCHVDKLDLDRLIDSDASCVLHPATSITAIEASGPRMIVKGEGNEIIDSTGARYLDAVAGLWSVNVGYGRKALADAMQYAAQQLAYYPTFSSASNVWQVALAEKVLSIAPKGMGKVFFGNSGSDANDTLIKIAWHYHALQGNAFKTKILARHQSYHGTSISTAGLTGLPSFHKDYPIPLDFIKHVDCPHYYRFGLNGETEAEYCQRLMTNIEETIQKEGANTIAAFFAEPILGAGGVIEPPSGYYPKLKRLLKKYNILFVVDEVVCGFGRVGEWFGSQALAIEPDMLSCAKGLTSGYFPLSAALINNEIWEVLKIGSEKNGAFYHGYTYSGHPVGCCVGLENFNILQQEHLIEAAKAQGEYLHEQLNQVLGDHCYVGEIRGKGLLAGIQLVRDKDLKALPEASEKWPLLVSEKARELGVIIRPLPSVASVALSPPLTISKQEIDKVVSVLKESLGAIPS